LLSKARSLMYPPRKKCMDLERDTISLPERTPAKDSVGIPRRILFSALMSSGMSSLDPKDAIADYSSLTEAQVKTLDQWEAFFEKVGSETQSLVHLLTF
jgi:hypothetical protein